MKTLYEIYDDVRECRDVSNEDLRLAVCMYRNLLWFANHDVEQLYKDCNKTPFTKLRYEENVMRYKKALQCIPKEWLGEENIPGTKQWKSKEELCEGLLHSYEKWKERNNNK